MLYLTIIATTMRRVLVTGRNGQLGMAIAMLSRNSKAEYLFTTHQDLNICDKKQVEDYLLVNKIDIVINCAAYTDVEGAEVDNEVAELVNCHGVLILAQLCLKHNIQLIHISTDYVFGGDKRRRTPYSEEELPSPINKYGFSKARGEVAAIKHNGIVIRTSWLYSPWGKNFLLTMLHLGKERQEVSVVNDQRGAPTSSLGLARALVAIIDNGEIDNMHNIYHYTDGSDCTWYDFACEIMAQAGMTCRVVPCTSAERNMRAERPAYSVLSTERIAAIRGVEIAPWQERLSEVITLINE